MKMSKTLDNKKEISITQPLKPIFSMSGTRPEMIFEVSSTCSCPQCNSTDCFKIRYENANLQCTCPSCKYASYKNVQSKTPSHESYRELVTKVKDFNDKSVLNTATSSKLPNKKPHDECNGKASKDVVREVAEDSLHTNIIKNMANIKSDGENESLIVTLNILKENDPKDRSLNNIKRDLPHHKFNSGSYLAKECKVEHSLNFATDKKENEQDYTLNSYIKNDVANKKSDKENKDERKVYFKSHIKFLEVTEKVVKEREQKDSLQLEKTKRIIKENKQNNNITNNLATKNSDELLVTRKVLKEREQKDPLNQKNIKEYEQKDTLNNKIKSDFTNKKKSDGQFNSHERKTNREDEINCNKCGKKHKNKESLISIIKYSKSYYSIKNNKSCCETNKRDEKSHEQKSTLSTCYKDDLPHKNSVNIKYRKITKKFVNEHVQTDTLDKHIKKENQEVDLPERANFRHKDTTFIKDKVKKTERSYEESYTRNYSVAMTYNRKEEKTEFENPTATLSAQIMDLPYQDFKDSLSLHKSGIMNSSQITKQDILAKLKEIYKACSCKVCECISSFSGNYVSKNDTCAQLDRQIPQNDCQQLPHSGCPCYRCDRKDCRGVWKKEMAAAMNCDCKPCDCVQFAQSFTKRCDCEPCQCAECTLINTHSQRPVTVAPVQGNFQQSRCQCDPCECANCTHNYGAMVSSLMREVSTGMVSQSNCNCNSCASNICQFDGVDCRCDTRNKIVSKPIDRSDRDYDLHQAIVGENSFSRKTSDKFKNNDTVAMFTFADHTYSNSGFSKSENDHRVMDCELNFVEDKEKRGIKIRNLYEDEDSPLAFSNLSDNSLSVNKCELCECRWYCRNEEAESDVMKTTRALSEYSYNTCNCMACKGLEKAFANHNESRRTEISFYKSTQNGEGISDNIETEFLNPLKKGKLLTPGMFEAKIRSPTKTQMSGLFIVKELLPINTILKLNGKISSKKLLSTQNLTKYLSNSVKKDFNGDHNLSSYKNMNSKYSNDSNLQTDSNKFSKHCDCPVDENNIGNSGSLQTNFIIQKKSTSSVNNITNYVNHNNTEMEVIIKDEAELFNSQVSNVRYRSKVRNSDADLFFSRIETLEKSLSQLQEDISLNCKNLAEIWSKDDNCNEKCSVSSTKIDFDKNIIIMKKSYENSITDAAKYLDINEESNKLQKMEHEIINKGGNTSDGINRNLIDTINFDQNDSFSKGDNKIYTQPVKRSQKSVTKSKNYITRSKFKKLSKKFNNQIIDFITEHLKENYRHHGYNLNRKCTKSTSTSYENCSVLNQLKFEEDARLPLKEDFESNAKLWSVSRKNLYVNNTKVTCNDDEKTDCNNPELEINTKRALQSISSQTNETRGHVALAKLQTEVSKLLNSSLLQQLGYNKIYLTSDMDKENIGNTYYCRPKTELELGLKHIICCDASLQTSKLTLLVEKEINCDIGQSMENMKINMAKLLDFLLTRTVCKSELTRPIATLPEMFTIPKVNHVKNSCEGLKARFLAVRKVSDHTVLVRWKVPHEVEHVQGYELQVDGRTVQKILSPTRCVAVLTCLPHCDKLLLTVRTLTFSVLPSGHRPAATSTIVYYPREKHSRHNQRNMSLHAGS